VRLGLYLVAAVAFGALMSYTALRHLSPRGTDGQEWGVIAATFGEGASLYGLFESKKACLDARAAFIDEYASMVAKYDTVLKKDSRAVVFTDAGVSVMTTFACLPFAEIREMPLLPPRAGDNSERR